MDDMDSAYLEVCAAVAFRDGKLLLASRRPGGSLAGKWEFPGGKQGEGESLADCIRRELQEELGLEITDALELFSLVHRYPEKTVRLHFMLCDVAENCRPEAKEGQSFGWHDHRQLNDLDWAPADREACDMLKGDGQLSRMADVSVAEPSRTDQFRCWLRGQGRPPCCRELGKPSWLRAPFMGGKEHVEMRSLLQRAKLHTVCDSAKCPNRGDCWKHRTATFMVLGDICTRNCKFCSVAHGKPRPVDPEEPQHVAETVETLGLRFAVITCVTRDDLPDGGSVPIAATVKAIKTRCPDVKVEVLVSDCKGSHDAVDTVLASGVSVFGHNIETVERLTPVIRGYATYRGSLDVLKYAAQHVPQGCAVKSGMMLGLGETADEIRQALVDLHDAGVSIVTLGQYLQPTKDNWPVARMVSPEEFEDWKRVAEREIGFSCAVCGPLVRSSYHASEAFSSSGH